MQCGLSKPARQASLMAHTDLSPLCSPDACKSPDRSKSGFDAWTKGSSNLFGFAVCSDAKLLPLVSFVPAHMGENTCSMGLKPIGTDSHCKLKLIQVSLLLHISRSRQPCIIHTYSKQRLMDGKNENLLVVSSTHCTTRVLSPPLQRALHSPHSSATCKRPTIYSQRNTGVY